MALWATFPVDSEIQMSGYPVLRLLGLFLLHIGYWFYNNSELSELNLVSRGLVNDGTFDQFGSTNQCVCFLGSTSHPLSEPNINTDACTRGISEPTSHHLKLNRLVLPDRSDCPRRPELKDHGHEGT